jgi:activating signal cointegrator complex subunit 2
MVSLHEKYISEIGLDGRETNMPALSPSRVQSRDYINYKPPPSDCADRASVEEWLDRARFIEEDLHWLLKLPHDRSSNFSSALDWQFVIHQYFNL